MRIGSCYWGEAIINQTAQWGRARVNFEYYAALYEDLIKGHAYKTRQLVRYLVKKHFNPAFGQRRIVEITNYDLRAYINHKKQKYRVFNHLKYFKAIVQVARDMEVRVAEFNVPCPDPLSAKSKLYGHAEIARLLGACRLRKLWALRLAIYIGYTSGLRKTEILKLPWRYVDLERGLFLLPADYFKRTKRVKAREIPIHKTVLRILRARRRRDKFSQWVFPGRVPGKPQTAVERTWQRLKRNVGVTGTFHSLRGTCASHICHIGVDAEMTCKMMGMTIEVFRRDYLTVSENVARFAIENAPKMSREPVKETLKFVRDVITRELRSGT